MDRLGIDIGSKTIKMALMDATTGKLRYSSYIRHFSKVKDKLESALRDIVAQRIGAGGDTGKLARGGARQKEAFRQLNAGVGGTRAVDARIEGFRAPDDIPAESAIKPNDPRSPPPSSGNEGTRGELSGTVLPHCQETVVKTTGCRYAGIVEWRAWTSSA